MTCPYSRNHYQDCLNNLEGSTLYGSRLNSTSVQVSEKVARDWCASRGNIPYFETSAKEGYNVDAAFFCAAQAALDSEHHDQDM